MALNSFAFQATVPHEYITAEIDVDNVLSLRKKLKETGESVTVNDFIIKAVAVALRVRFRFQKAVDLGHFFRRCPQ